SFEIKDAPGTKQYKPEDIQELFHQLLNDVQNIHEELAEYINTPGWNRPAFYDDDDDDDVDYTIVTPVLSTEEPVDSLSMGDKHLDTILTTKSDEVIKSSVEDLIPIPSEFEVVRFVFAFGFWVRTCIDVSWCPCSCFGLSPFTYSLEWCMSTRSSARNLFLPLDNPELTIQRRSHADPTLLNDFEMAAENSCQFHGLPGDDANKHLDKFLHVKVNGVTDDALRLYLFPHSLTHHATAWFGHRPRNSSNTFEQMAKMFLETYFPPSMVTKLRNEITNFRHHPDESLFEAWERYKLSIDRCPNHNMLPVTQIDTFYNGLNLRHRDTINVVNQQVKAVTPNCETCGGPHSFNDCLATVGQTQNVYAAGAYQGNTITNPKEELKGITTRSGTAYQGPTIPTTFSSLPPVVERETEVAKDMVHHTNNGSTKDVQPPVVQTESLILNSEPVVAPIIEPVAAPVSALKPNLKPSIPYPSRLQDQKLRDKANDQKEKFFQIFKDLNFNITFADALILMPKFSPFIKILLTNKDKLSELDRTLLNEHFLAVLLKKLPEKLGDPGKFLIPLWNKLSLPELSPTCMTLELADRLISRSVGVAEDVFVKVGTFHFPADFIVVDFDANPRVPLILRRSFLKTERALIDVFEGELTLRIGKEAITFNLDQTLRYSANYNDMTTNRIDVIDMACEEESDFLLEEVDAFLAIEDDSTSPKVDQSYNYLPQVRKELKLCEAKIDKSSIDEPPEVELKDLPPHLEYVFLECNDKLPVIIAKDLSVEEKTALMTVLKSHKRAIAWKLSDIKGIDLEFYTHKILMEDDFEPVVQHQRRVNPKIHDVIKNEVLKLLDAGLIYPISDSPWVSPVHCVPKKGSFTVVENEKNELILTRLVTGWRVCIDYRKLNEATRKDHFLLPFMDQMLERLTGNDYYYFLNGFSGYFQIPIDPKDQEKTTFTCPYGMFAYQKMLKRCEDTNLCLKWEKSHFMVKERIVLGHKISKNGIEVDKAKVKVIAKLPHPTTVKGIRRFQGGIAPLGSTPPRFTFKVIDIKGAENLAADHLSQLENPHQNVLDPKKINESFPLETLNMVSSREPCYNQDFNFSQDFQDVPQQYPCCDDCGVTHDAYQCQPMNEVYDYGQNSCYDSTSIGFDQSQPQQYTVDHLIFNAHNDYLDSQIQLSSTLAKIKDQMTSITSLCELACQVAQKKLEEKQIEEERAAKAKYWKLLVFYDDDDDEERSDFLDDNTISGFTPFSAITPDEPVLSTEEPDNSLGMGDEHLDTIPATESDQFIKSSVKTIILIPSESEGIPEHMCDVPSNDNSPPLDISKDQFEDLSESNKEFSSTDDDSFSLDNIDHVEASPLDSELVSSEVMEIVILEVGGIKASDDNPILFYDPIISGNPPNLTPSGETFLNDDHSSDFKTKSSSTSLTSLLEETNNFDNSLPEFTTFSKVLFDAECESDSSDDKSSSDEDVLEKIVSKLLSEEEIIPMESLHTHDSSLSISDSLMKEIDLFCTPNYPMLPGIVDEDYDSERDIPIPKDLPRNNTFSFAKK
nr:DNA-directed DNA polymerase [Tanacetum cinerariifolium]